MTKTGAYQWVHVRRPAVAAVLVLSVANAKRLRKKTLFATSYNTYLKRFHSAAARLGLVGYSPRSLRSGGATSDLLDKVPMVDILYRGRWKRRRTAESYIQSGRCILLENQNAVVARYGERVAAQLVALFRATQFR